MVADFATVLLNSAGVLHLVLQTSGVAHNGLQENALAHHVTKTCQEPEASCSAVEPSHLTSSVLLVGCECCIERPVPHAHFFGCMGTARCYA